MRSFFRKALLFSFLGLFLTYQGSAWAITAQDISSNSTLTTITAKVLKIDHVTRKVTLEVPGGNKVNLKVGKQVKNLDQVKVNDMVKTQYYESVAWEILPPGSKAEPSVSKTVTTAKAAKGDEPAAEAMETTSVTGTIDKLDPATGMVTLKIGEGQMLPFKVRYPDKLKDMKVGQQVAASYTEAYAISVDPAGK